jgi:hypothetical protein
MSKSTLTRRALVASTAAVPAAAALSLPAVADTADAELFRLGVALDRIEQDWIAQAEIDVKRNAQWEAACEAAGLPRLDFEDFPSRDEYLAYHDKRWSLHTEEYLKEQERAKLGEPDVWDKINDRLSPLVDEILSLKAATPAGLAVQAKATVYSASDLWDGQIEDTHKLLFIEAACAFCNIAPWPIARRAAS